jgi:hypothetical protein
MIETEKMSLKRLFLGKCNVKRPLKKIFWRGTKTPRCLEAYVALQWPPFFKPCEPAGWRVIFLKLQLVHCIPSKETITSTIFVQNKRCPYVLFGESETGIQKNLGANCAQQQPQHWRCQPLPCSEATVDGFIFSMLPFAFPTDAHQ